MKRGYGGLNILRREDPGIGGRGGRVLILVTRPFPTEHALANFPE